MAARDRHTYRVRFHNGRQIYEVYVREVFNSDIYGFVELGKFVFGKPSQMVIDPSEDKLRTEFGGVSRTLVPLHSIIRIDEVKKEGHCEDLGGRRKQHYAVPICVAGQIEKTSGEHRTNRPLPR